MALLTICLACSTFMIVLLFRELRAPFTKQRGGKFPKQRTEAKRVVRPGWNGSHAGVTQAFRGAKRASGDRRRAALHAGTWQSQSGEKRRAGPIFARQKDTRRRIWFGFGRRQFERLKRFSQHGCIFLSVVAVPSSHNARARTRSFRTAASLSVMTYSTGGSCPNFTLGPLRRSLSIDIYFMLELLAEKII